LCRPPHCVRHRDYIHPSRLLTDYIPFPILPWVTTLLTLTLSFSSTPAVHSATPTTASPRRCRSRHTSRRTEMATSPSFVLHRKY
uniref:Uncharacterized protein n=1 Tax=Aegilops tauschii subsp. strangulata TaxID=200361 RepID=A0A453GZE6_AEGTS